MSSRILRTGMAAALVLLGALAGCGGDGGGGDFAAEGESCKAGTDCGEALYCAFAAAKATSGLCTKLPASCDAATAKCTNACGDALDTECGSGGSSVCLSVGNKITYTCQKPTGGTTPEHQTCAAGSDCVTGLLCKVVMGAGTCTKAPTACNGTPECTGACGDAIIALCGGGSPGCSGSGVVTLSCE